MSEQNYDFQKRLLRVHRPDRRIEKPLEKGKIEITAAWTITYPAGNAFLGRCAADLADYFAVSMGLPLSVGENAVGKRIVYVIDQSLSREGAYRTEVSDLEVRLIGKDERAAAQAGYLLEDVLNLEEAPYLMPGVTDRAPIFRCRMVHSGYAEDDFPDEHLNAIAHSGINAILVFACDVNKSPMHELDFNDLIARAARYGLDVYAYSYMKTAMHPLDEGAEAYYDSLFGNLFRKCPGFKGIVFVGESVQFPSRDERTSGRMRTDNIDRFGNKIIQKPDPGWFPCNDYPDWLALVKKVIRREKADADIVFWTYNWGKCAEADRIALIDALPTDISLQATFEMFENFKRDGVSSRSIDYTISFPGPGAYFLSEAKAAKRRGIPLYSMTNAGGLTWDVGMVPYEPAPYQWLKRYDAMRMCHREYGLCGSMDCHHYGFYPSFISDLAKTLFTDESADGEAVIDRLIARDWGAENLAVVRKAYQAFSDAVNDFIMTDEEQYGPLRIGPAYPFVLFRDHQLVLPSNPKAHHKDNMICFPNYAYPLHVAARKEQFMGEIRLYKASADRLITGAEALRALLPGLPPAKRDEAQRIAGVAEFMGRTALTVHHVKRWYLEKQGLLSDDGAFDRHLDALLALAAAERENVLATIPLTDFDSRLGFEPSMDYKGDTAHLRWKLAHLDRMVSEEIPALRAKGVVENPTRMDFPRNAWAYRFE
ncbi:MAG: hypothetical protein E7585_07320 [Ruminococcaceae bacterium]|nr:hypothetical protein [Oscillospiraceae bacterium]